MRYPSLFATACAAGLLIGFGLSCSSSSSGCKTNQDCAFGYTCSQGVCYAPKGSTSSSSGGQGGTSAAKPQTSSTGATGLPSLTNGGRTSGTSTGSGSTTSAATTTTTTTGGTGATSCGCSSSCCSQIAGSGMTCPDGKQCWGETDAGVPFYCNYQTGKCDPFDPCDGNSGVWSCQATGGQTGGTTGGGAGTTGGGTVTVQPGGLSFAVIGDTRPPNPCSSISDCSSGSDAYPTQVITSIYSDIQALSPVPQYVLATGDFQDNDPGSNTASWQIQQYESAIGASKYAGAIYPAMGNHECNGTPSSECGSNGANGITENYTAFLSLLSSVGVTNNNGLAYYSEGPFTLASGQTVKFVMIAANAWDSTQQSWLDGALSQATTYTFVVRHEPDDATGLSGWAGIAESDAVMANHPGGVTLRLEGHTHELRWSWGSAGVDGGAGEAIVGNGGAQPWDCTATTTTIYCDYGYLLCQQRTDNSLQCTPYAATGNVPAPSPAPFAVYPDGSEDRN